MKKLDQATVRLTAGFRAAALLLALVLFIGGQAVSAEPSASSPPGYDKSAAQGLTKAVKKHAVGIYQGQADSHTVEISVYGNPVALQFGETLSAPVEKLEEGAKVVFQYTEQRVKGDDIVRYYRLLSIKEAED